MAKLHPFTVLKIQEEFLCGETKAGICRKLGLTVPTVRKYCEGLVPGDKAALASIRSKKAQHSSIETIEQVHAVYGGVEAKHLVEKTKDVANMIIENVTLEDIQGASFKDKIIGYGILMDKLRDTIRESTKTNISLSIAINKLEAEDCKVVAKAKNEESEVILADFEEVNDG